MIDPAVRNFDKVWTRFLSRLGMYSPTAVSTLRPGATAEQIAHLEAVLGFALHPDVGALLERHNGTEYAEYGGSAEGADFLPSGYMLDSIDQILAGHQQRMDLSAQTRALGSSEDDDLYAHAYQWVPIAHSISAAILLVEHRPGPSYGHVISLGIGSGDFEGTKWADTPLEFFDALTDSLNTRRPFHDETPGVRESDSTGEILMYWEQPAGDLPEDPFPRAWYFE
ncbi:SMI1/KNR4 family protein [Streptomyces sp. NPDC101166]|uniref:SMI1/KNR4 family protein n=1 Tax=Streptomyces sp. NPDC101166 TaxID=3366120 RepID=UPI00382B055E